MRAISNMIGFFFLLVAYDPLLSCLTPNVGQIKGKRSNIMEDVLQVYSEFEDVVEHYLQVCFIGEDGVDGGGLLKDMLSVFWIEAFKRECPLKSSKRWHMMKNQNSSYFIQR